MLIPPTRNVPVKDGNSTIIVKAAMPVASATYAAAGANVTRDLYIAASDKRFDTFGAAFDAARAAVRNNQAQAVVQARDGVYITPLSTHVEVRTDEGKTVRVEMRFEMPSGDVRGTRTWSPLQAVVGRDAWVDFRNSDGAVAVPLPPVSKSA